MALSIFPAMSADTEKSVHPFFKRGNDRPYIRDEIPNSESSEPLISEGPELPLPESRPKRTTTGKRKAKNDEGRGKIQRTLSQIANPKGPSEHDVVVNLCTSEPNGEDGPRKRRRTPEYDPIEVGQEDAQSEVIQVEMSSPARPTEDRASPQVIIPRSSPLPTTHASGKEDLVQVPIEITSDLALPSTPPKKLLRLNANGKFSSPPSKKPKDQLEPDVEPPKRRGRPRRSAAANTKRELLVKIHYGCDDQSRAVLADRISRILSGADIVTITALDSQPTTPKRAPRKRAISKEATPKRATPKKPPHPFFNREKPKAQPPPKHESPRKTSAVTPGKLKMHAMSERPNASQDTQSFGSALLRDRHMVKHPGAKEAPFPDREQAHARGEDVNYVKLPMNDATFNMLFSRRKRKQARLPLPPHESILTQFSSQLAPESDRIQRSDGFYEPIDGLKVPGRLILSGREVAERVSHELSVQLDDGNADELGFLSSQPRPHPALQIMYEKIPDTLTAFDESRGETMTWTQKHAPSSSTTVLQPENEIVILKDWLKSLAVQSVEVTTLDTKNPISKPTERPKGKRKKKADEMDDFLVDSDEDVREMSEVIDATIASPQGSRKTLKSVVQVGGDGKKLNNAVLLSGPHGCGKTAAAYAVAKELGFKVFEISSSERRSGKVVLDKIGDMTENHLVRHHGSEAADVPVTEEPSHMDQAFQKDLQSGRQGKMSAFFTTSIKPAAKPKQPEPKKIIKERTQKAVLEALKKPAKDQQQSLILLEEVDVLFKDDKEFWTTILKLVTTSRRPFIMTCNDEDLVPLQAISLHAVLRFREPPLDLATDYMLLVAAAEGHLLQRNAVSSLYRHHNSDLRASIMELDYWCQMGVGDPREGLGWVFQRWPLGSDLDLHGRRLRLVSNGTYDGGMGLKPAHDPSTEEALLWAWTEFDVPPAAALGWAPESANAPFNYGLKADIDGSQNRKALRRHLELSEALSVADACTACGLYESRPLDATCPTLSDKARTHYIEGMQLLQTDEAVDYSDMSKHLLVAMTHLAQKSFGESTRSLKPDNILANIPESKSITDPALTRHAFSCFDAIASPAEISLLNPGLQQSVFDSPLDIIALDLAPYVRSIVQYDEALEEQRERLNLFTSEGRRTKRARTTRAARSALEGGQRATTRRERWFTKDLDMQAVMSTGGKDWPKFGGSPPSLADRSATEGTEAPASSAETA